MEGLQPLHRRVAGIDVHRMLHVVSVLIEQADGRVERQSRQFGGFRRDCRALAAWLAGLGVEPGPSHEAASLTAGAGRAVFGDSRCSIRPSGA